MIMNKNENFENMIMRNVTNKMINESSYEPLLKKYLIKKSWYGDCTVKQLVDNFNNIATFIRFDLSKADYIKDWTIEFAYFNTTRCFCSRYLLRLILPKSLLLYLLILLIMWFMLCKK